MKDYWTVVLLMLIIYAASYWLVYDLKKCERMFPDKLVFHLNLALMNVYEPKNRRLIRWKDEKIRIIKIIESESDTIDMKHEIIGGGIENHDNVLFYK